MIKNITFLPFLIISAYTLSYGSSLSTEKIKIEDVLQKSRNAYESIDIYASLFGKRSNINSIINYFGLETSSFRNYRGDMISTNINNGEVVVDTKLNSRQVKRSLKNFFLNSIQPYWSIKKEENGKLKVYYPFSVKSSGNIQISNINRSFNFYVGDDIPTPRTKNYWFTSRNWTNYYEMLYWNGNDWLNLSSDPYIYFSPVNGEIPNRTITITKSYWIKSPVSVSRTTTSIKCQNGATYNPYKERCEAYTSNACPSDYTYISSRDKCRKYYYTSLVTNYQRYTEDVFDHWEYANKIRNTHEQFVQQADTSQVQEDGILPTTRTVEFLYSNPTTTRVCVSSHTETKCVSKDAIKYRKGCYQSYQSTGRSCTRHSFESDPSLCNPGETCLASGVGTYTCYYSTPQQVCTDGEYWSCGHLPGLYMVCKQGDIQKTHKCMVPSEQSVEVCDSYNESTTCPNGSYLKRDGLCYDSSTYYYCPSGYTLRDGLCYSNNNSNNTEYTYSCPIGTYLNEDDKNCYKRVTSYSCPSGYTNNNGNCKKAIYRTVTRTRVTYHCPSGYNRSGGRCSRVDYRTPSCYGKRMPVYPYYSTPYYGHNGVCYSDAGLYCKTHGVSWDGRYRCFDYKYYCEPSRSWSWSTYSGHRYKISGGYHLETRQGLCVKYLFSCPVDKGHLYGRKEHPVYSDPSVLLNQLGSNVDDRMNEVVSTLVHQDVVKRNENGSLCAKIGYSTLNQSRNAQTYTINNTRVKGF